LPDTVHEDKHRRRRAARRGPDPSRRATCRFASTSSPTTPCRGVRWAGTATRRAPTTSPPRSSASDSSLLATTARTSRCCRTTCGSSPRARGSPSTATRSSGTSTSSRCPGQRAPRPIANAEVIFGGTAGDTTTQISAADRRRASSSCCPPRSPAVAARGGPQGAVAFGGPRGGAPVANRFADAAAVATIDLDDLTMAQRAAINEPTVATQTAAGRPGFGPARGAGRFHRAAQGADRAAQPAGAAAHHACRRGARSSRARSFESLAPGTKGGTVNASLEFVELPSEFARNVIGIVPGSDPVLKNQYVAIGAHNDHVGFARRSTRTR
jgi:hypothetical protein